MARVTEYVQINEADLMWFLLITGAIVYCLIDAVLSACCSIFSINRGTVVVGNTGTVTINGVRITSNRTQSQAAELRLVAYDKDGQELESVELQQGTKIELVINAGSTGRIDTVTAAMGNVTVEQAGDIGSIRTSQGNISVTKCGNIDTLRTSQGDIDVQDCDRVRHSKTSQGDIRIGRQRSPSRRPP
jgi:hypothetical protein